MDEIAGNRDMILQSISKCMIITLLEIFAIDQKGQNITGNRHVNLLNTFI